MSVTRHDMEGLRVMVRLVGDDAHAASFQTLGQYRAALLERLGELLAVAPVVVGFDQGAEGGDLTGRVAMKDGRPVCWSCGMAVRPLLVTPRPGGHVLECRECGGGGA